ncbi:hypothetical protein ACFYWX_29785 [Streptomyces sp. NPDC002888]|uniref:hypothetical protein n=1 Tax=Streptomyces sp. NPDC002888 TaxID=3364668 RepID=UPI0036BE4028
MLYRYAALRRRCHTLLKDIELPTPFSVDALCAQLALRRGRHLYLHPLPEKTAGAGACGVWLATEDTDHVFFERRTSRLHQEHIVLHEVGHMLLDHRGTDPAPDLVGLLPDLSPRLVRRLLARTAYSTRQEQEAEMLASLIRVKAGHPFAAHRPPRPNEAEQALGLHD